jgi:hypothetical protein
MCGEIFYRHTLHFYSLVTLDSHTTAQDISSQHNSYFEYQQPDINSFLCRHSTTSDMNGFLLCLLRVPHKEGSVGNKTGVDIALAYSRDV